MNKYDRNLTLEMAHMCRVCLRTEQNIHTLSTEEVYWYQTMCYKVLNSDLKVYICTVCRYQLRKCMKFSLLCRDADSRFHQMVQEGSDSQHILQPTFTVNLITTPPKMYYLGPEDVHLETNKYTSYDCDNMYNSVFDSDDAMSEDELPLVMLNKSEVEEDKVRKRRKNETMSRKNHDETEMEIKIESDIKEETDFITEDICQKTNGRKSKKTVKEGFSSRMVQETDQYMVIKLTKEQVLEEMKTKLNSDKYIRALYKCDRCVKGFNFEDVLRNHMERHTKENGEHKCDICSQYCPSMVSLRGHMKSHTTRYKCKICGDVRLSRQHLLEHHAISHTCAATEYTCEHCYFTTNKRTVIQRHVKTHKPSERHACHECGALFQNIESLRVHSARHDKSRSLQCDYCTRKFIYPSLLQKHIQSVHIHKDYYCVECDIRFKSPDNLKLHFKKAKKHRDSSSYTHQCPQCSDKFISPTTLSVHLTTTHGHPKGYSCDVCRRMYSSRESLKGHMRRVHAEKRLSCHVCEKRFTRKSILTAHLRTHTSEDCLSRSVQLLENAECKYYLCKSTFCRNNNRWGRKVFSWRPPAGRRCVGRPPPGGMMVL